MLAKLLSLLSGELRLPQYVHHYWKDVPDVCPASSDFAKTGQVPESFLPGLNAPMGMRETSPPDIHKVRARLAPYNPLMRKIVVFKANNSTKQDFI